MKIIKRNKTRPSLEHTVAFSFACVCITPLPMVQPLNRATCVLCPKQSFSKARRSGDREGMENGVGAGVGVETEDRTVLLQKVPSELKPDSKSLVKAMT